MLSLDSPYSLNGSRILEAEELSETSILHERKDYGFLLERKDLGRQCSFFTDGTGTNSFLREGAASSSPSKRNFQSRNSLHSHGDSDLKRAIREVVKTELSVFAEDFKDWLDRRLNIGISKAAGIPESKSQRLRLHKSMADHEFEHRILEKNTTHHSLVHPSAAPNEVQWTLAIESKQTSAVQSLLEEEADPNMHLGQFKLEGSTKTYSPCSLLAAAVIAGSIDIVRMLVQYQADPNNSTYCFKAGATSMPWTGEAIFATIRAGVGDLAMLQELVELKANPSAVSTNNANLVWQSCYFGHIAILNLLLQWGVDVDVPAESANREGLFYSPLHIAVVQDRSIAIIEKLISKRAEIDKANEEKKTPLLDAISRGRVSAVRILVSNGAKLVPCSDEDLKTSNRPLDVLFQKSHPVLLRAAAIGLADQEEQMRACTIADLYKFMLCPLSKAEILDAVFKRRMLRYWNPNYASEVVMSEAFIRNSEILDHRQVHYFVNCAVSSVNSATMDYFLKQKWEPDARIKTLVKNLERKPSRGIMNWLRMTLTGYTHSLSSVRTFEAVVPAFHDDMRIIKAIADSSIHEPFLKLKSCEAILQNAWKDAWLYTFSEALLNIILLLVSVVLAHFIGNAAPCHDLRYSSCESNDTLDEIRVVAVVGIPVELLLLLRDAVRLIAYMTHGLQMRLVISFELATNLIDGVLLLTLYITRADIISDVLFRAAFSLNCIGRWVNVMYSIAPIRRFGLRAMPILHTVSSVAPFLTMFALCVLAFSTALVSLGVDDFWYGEAFLSVFLFGSTAEPDFLPNTSSMAAKSYKGLILRFLFVLSTFFVAITMVNCFIASMIATYKTGSTSKHQLYQVRLAREILKHLATRHSLRRVCEVFGRREALGESSYLWYAVQPEDK